MTIHEKLKAAGVELDAHESDLYAKVDDKSRLIIAEYEHRQNVTTFRSEIDGSPWYDIPFANDAFWQKGYEMMGGKGSLNENHPH